MAGTNLTGKGNDVLLDAEGWGHYVGCVLSIANRRRTEGWNWFGEGDDMIFVDDRARARQSPVGRLLQYSILVPNGAAQAVPGAAWNGVPLGVILMS